MRGLVKQSEIHTNFCSLYTRYLRYHILGVICEIWPSLKIFKWPAKIIELLYSINMLPSTNSNDTQFKTHYFILPCPIDSVLSCGIVNSHLNTKISSIQPIISRTFDRYGFLSSALRRSVIQPSSTQILVTACISHCAAFRQAAVPCFLANILFSVTQKFYEADMQVFNWTSARYTLTRRANNFLAIGSTSKSFSLASCNVLCRHTEVARHFCYCQSSCLTKRRACLLSR